MTRDTQVERILDALITAMEQHVKGALGKSGGSEFDFGKACGFYQGLQTAIQTAEDVIAQDNKR